MSATRISIVTPSFNQAAFVGDTLESVLSQGYPNLEYIVVDGASTDGSVEIIERRASELAYFVSEPDQGHGQALNKGFAHSTGQIMAWLNSDDKYCPWTLQTVAEIFDAHPDVEWIGGLHGTWNVKGAMVTSIWAPKNIFDFLEGNYGWIQQETVFWRRSLWERAGGYIHEGYRLMVDGELWTRFFEHADLWNAHCVLGGYRVHGRNRAALQHTMIHWEMHAAVAAMASRVDQAALAGRVRDYPMLSFDHKTGGWIKSLVPREAPR